MTLDEQRRMAMLEATLREMLRINKEADLDSRSDGSIGFELGLGDSLLSSWKNIKHKAEMLVGKP